MPAAMGAPEAGQRPARPSGTGSDQHVVAAEKTLGGSRQDRSRQPPHHSPDPGVLNRAEHTRRNEADPLASSNYPVQAAPV